MKGDDLMVSTCPDGTQLVLCGIILVCVCVCCCRCQQLHLSPADGAVEPTSPVIVVNLNK